MPARSLLVCLLAPLLLLACDPPRQTEPDPTPEATSPNDTPANPAPANPVTPPADPTATPPDLAAPPADAQRTANGVAWKVLRPGTGTAHPGPNDTVTVHYAGWTTDGKKFDASYDRNEPLTMPLYAVIPGWSEGIQPMTVGEKRRLWIPESLAYKGRPGFPAGMLVFDVDLIEIARTPGAQ